MSKLIERDAAVEVLNQLVRERFSLSDGFQFYIDALKDVELNVMALPTVDAVPVVRCRDCLYWQKSSLFRGHTVCRYVLDCSVVRREDDFCSRGERKDGEAHD